MPNLLYKTSLLLLLLNTAFVTLAQEGDSAAVIQLDSIVVRAFEQNRGWKEVPAAINYIGSATLQRFPTASIVSAINTAPGLRMEERSPGSYRFNIRGSSLRSPFGVRNVKVYYNGIPLTDPGGHTYLNNLGFYNYASVEVVKGPGSSLYGAGTGGVMLIEGAGRQQEAGAGIAYTTGSWGLQQGSIFTNTGNENRANQVSFQHQQSKGYRQHSQLRRSVVSWNGRYRFDEKGELKTTVLFSNLFYQTPGALNLAEYNINPKASRPAGAGFPSATEARAAIYQKMVVAGVSYGQQLAPYLQNKTVAYGAFTQLKNAAIRNYGVVNEPHGGGRTLFTAQKDFKTNSLKLDAGAEWQQGFSFANIHQNNLGQPDTLQTADDITNRQSFVFVQATWQVQRWLLVAGASLNSMKVKAQRWQPQPLPLNHRRFNNEWAPRVAILYRLPQWSLYSSISKGFSPPATSELLPTGSAINLKLHAEDGTNYDVGLKGTFFNRLTVDANAFLFYLTNTIVQRRDAGGGEMFVNAGKTKQHGIETALQYAFTPGPFVTQSNLWLSHTWHRFRYADFKQQANNFSGNALPGVAPHSVAAGLDFQMLQKLSGALTYYYSDAVPLNDANTTFANAYHLLGFKLGWQQNIGNKIQITFTAGAENLLNETYSLGNDINGFGGRYYNAAPGRNYFAGIAFSCLK